MSSPHGFIEQLAAVAEQGEPFVAVTLVKVRGSAPQDAGSKMLVTAAGLAFGTVGGGRVEQQAIQHAQQMLGQDAGQPPSLVEWNLKRDVGMTCGGAVTLYFETYNHRTWRIAVFGAGHVAQALIHSLGSLDCSVTCIDSRAEWLNRLPDHPRLAAVQAADPRQCVEGLEEQTFALCMTMGHQTDLPILEALLRLPQALPFVGVIGSRAKRAVLVRDLLARGLDPERAEAFHCPLGLELGSNQPGEIAISIAAQLITVRDALGAEARPRVPAAEQAATQTNSQIQQSQQQQ